MLVSVTTLSSYLYCPRKLFLQQVLKAEEPPKEALVKGSVRHEFYDIANTIEQEIVKKLNKTHTIENTSKLYSDEYSKILVKTIMSRKREIENVGLVPVELFRENWQHIKKEAIERSSFLFEFANKHNMYGDDLWENLTPKIKTEIRINSTKLRLKGIIDRIEVHKDEIIPFELKTGKAPATGVWPGHRIQVGAYALLAEEQFGVKIKRGFINYLDSRSIRPVSINPFLKAEIHEAKDSVISLLENKQLPEHCSNKGKCRSCSLQELCYNESQVYSMMKEMVVEHGRLRAC